MKKLNILVTGCGGDIGQSIGKILTEFEEVQNLYGFDITEKSASQFIYPNFQKGLPIKHPEYFLNLKAFVNLKRIDIIIPMAEPELRYLASNGPLYSFEGAVMVHANKQALQIGFDKLATSDFLVSNDLPSPRTFEASKYKQMDRFPFILKSRSGSGGKGLYKIDEKADIDYWIKKIDPNEFIVQELVGSSSEEYTCGVFRSKEREVRTIIFRRELTGGYSGYGEKVENSVIDDLIKNIATKINLRGSVNIQLRLQNGSPYVFEINPRFSSTVRFRSIFGFNDVIWSIQDALDLPISKYESRRFSKFYKGFNEFVC